MEKRIFLAVVISIALLGLWSWALPKFFPELAKKPEAAKVETATKTTTIDTVTATGGATPTVPASTVTTPAADGLQPVATLAPVAAAPISAERVQLSRIDTPEFT